jgi:pimeloyl-ACP methyl ester carboxylesterase
LVNYSHFSTSQRLRGPGQKEIAVRHSNWRLTKLVLFGSWIIICGSCCGQQTNALSSEAELSLTEARRSRSDPKVAAGYYLEAADAALRSINGRSGIVTSDSRLVYNRACQELAVLLQSNQGLWNRTETIQSQKHIYRLRFAGGSRVAGVWSPDYFNFFQTPRGLNKKIGGTPLMDSWGGVLVGVHRERESREYFLPPRGLAVSVTAVVDINRRSAKDSDVRDATLTLYEPGKRESIQLAGAKRPLDADFTAPIAYYRNPFLLGLAAMIMPGKYRERTGLYLLEPYDPDQIPVVFIHGLVSIPQMWAPTIQAIQLDPQLRGRFQFWVFAYPTGNPILLSGLRFRENLERIYQLYPRTKNVILIGHSMGGLVARMQAVNTGRVLWNGLFKNDADRLYAAVPPDGLLKKALIFNANPHVKRIVFICVPHRGSYLATSWIGSLGVGLVRLPGNLLTGAEGSIMTTLRVTAGLRHLPTGINGLSPRSPVLKTLDTLPITAPYHSIIGDRGRGDSPNSSDGVVPYWSSHLDGAQSELIVPGPHGSYALPQTVAELKRILRLELSSREKASHKATKAQRKGKLAKNDCDASPAFSFPSIRSQPLEILVPGLVLGRYIEQTAAMAGAALRLDGANTEH